MKKNLQTLKGFRDFLPERALAREKIFETIRTVFAKYGFLPLETPVLEYKEILEGKYGDEGEKLMYSFRDRGERDVAMRYDLTVPLARVVAQYQNELAMPFKRYQIAPVWRADNTQKGRYREFYQCDVDVVGSSSIIADAEVIACLNEALIALGVRDVVIKINNRKLLDSLIAEAGITNEIAAASTPRNDKNGNARNNRRAQVMRILDKLDKLGPEKVREELALVGVGTAERKKLFELLGTDIQDPKDILARFEGLPGAGELAALEEVLLGWGIKNYEIELALARGLDYYTGTIFEIILPDAAQYGSVTSGGRYDNLVGMFLTSPNFAPSRGGESKGRSVPAVGGSIGIDRLVAALEELELIKYDLVSDVLVCNLEEDLEEKYLQIARDMRAGGLKVDFYYEAGKLDRQLKYADKKNINFAVIIGPDEAKAGEVTVKNMKTGKQEKVRQKDLIKALSSRT